MKNDLCKGLSTDQMWFPLRRWNDLWILSYCPLYHEQKCLWSKTEDEIWLETCLTRFFSFLNIYLKHEWGGEISFMKSNLHTDHLFMIGIRYIQWTDGFMWGMTLCFSATVCIYLISIVGHLLQWQELPVFIGEFVLWSDLHLSYNKEQTLMTVLFLSIANTPLKYSHWSLETVCEPLD